MLNRKIKDGMSVTEKKTLRRICGFSSKDKIGNEYAVRGNVYLSQRKRGGERLKGFGDST